MINRKSEQHVVPQSWTKDTPSFDDWFEGNEGFIRPVRNGQILPVCPDDVPVTGKHYLVQDLYGNPLALVSGKSIPDVFADVNDSGGVPLWMH